MHTSASLMHFYHVQLRLDGMVYFDKKLNNKKQDKNDCLPDKSRWISDRNRNTNKISKLITYSLAISII